MIPTKQAIKTAVPSRKKTMLIFIRKAYKVAVAATGFIIGAANIKAIAVCKGIPFISKRRTIGMIPQSHVGKIKPNKLAMMILKNLFLGRTL